MFYFYIFRCADGTLYCGSTKNITQREQRHNSPTRGAKYTRIHGGGKIVYSETYKTIGEAIRREIEIKKWSRKKKENLIKTVKKQNSS